MIILTLVLLTTILFTYFLTTIVSNLWLIPVWIISGFLIGLILFLLSFIISSLFVTHTKIGNKGKHYYAQDLSDFVLWLTRVRLTKIIGKENIPKSNFVIYANHKSYMDPFIIKSAVRVKMGFAAKSGIYKLPFVRRWLHAVGSININRDNDREAIKEILKGIKYVEDGMSMLIFPEGGIKSREDEMMIGVKPGAYKLATKPGVPILPIAIIGATQIKNKAPFKKTKIKIIIDKPIHQEEYTKFNPVELGDHVFKIINKMIEENSPK